MENIIKLDVGTSKEMEVYSNLLLELVKRGLTFSSVISNGKASITLTGGF